MKRILSIAAACIFFAACNNEGETNGTNDTMTTVGADTTNTSPMRTDTGSRMNDTASYENMPQRSTDTTRRQ